MENIAIIILYFIFQFALMILYYKIGYARCEREFNNSPISFYMGGDLVMKVKHDKGGYIVKYYDKSKIIEQ